MDRMKKNLAAILGELQLLVARLNDAEGKEFLDRVQKARRVYVTGQGRSGLIVKTFAQRLMHLGLAVHVADEITTPRIGPGDLLLACSGSASTRITQDAMSSALEAGAAVVLITANPDGAMGDFADLLIALPAALGGEIQEGKVPSVQPQRSLFEQALLLYLDAAVLALRDRLKVPDEQMAKRHTNIE